MSRNLPILGIFFCFSLSLSAQKEEIPSTPSALKKDSEGWSDLFNKEFRGWKRVAIPPKSKLVENGSSHEMLIWDSELADGILHIEWKFKKSSDKKGYASGIYIRNTADGDIWHQVQVGDQNIGYFFGETLVNGTKRRFRSETQGTQRGYPAGEWNTTEISASQKTLTLWHNGYATSIWKECLVPKGYLGLESEGSVIEFRNAKWKPLK
jgi:hypothetical protein